MPGESALICDSCGTCWVGEPLVEIARLERKGDKFVASGKLKIAHCPNCGSAITHLSDAVPLELEGLTCGCGGNRFRFTINSKRSKGSKPTDWIFELDATCVKCNRRKFAEKILNFFKLKRIKVGAAGVDLQMR